MTQPTQTQNPPLIGPPAPGSQKIANESQVNDQLNIKEVATVNYNVYQRHEEPKSTTSGESTVNDAEDFDKPSSEENKDPTKDYSICPRFCQIDASELSNIYNFLIEEQVLLVSCYDKDVAVSAVDQLISRSQLESYNKRQLELKKSLKDEHPSIIWKNLSNKDFGWAKPTLIFLDAYHIPAQSLLEEDLLFRHVETSNIRTDLKQSERLLVCIVDPESFDDLLREKTTQTEQLCIWKLEFLKPLLSRESDVEELCEIIQQQSKRGLWGNTPKEIYKTVKGFYQNGTLREHIQKLKDNSKNSQNPIEIISRSKEIQAHELFEKSSSMEKIVLFVATYFPNITYEDFSSILLFLLGKETRTEKTVFNKKRKKKSRIVDSNDDIEETTENEKIVLLRDDWSQNEDDTLDKLGLKIRTADHGNESLDFELPYVRADLKRYLNEKKPTFLRRQTEQIRSYIPVLFQREDVEVLDNVVQLMTMMARKNPTNYGWRWLASLVISIRQNQELHFKDDTLSFLVDHINEIVNQAQVQIKENIILPCVARILIEMLKYEYLISIVTDFFKELFQFQGYYEQILKLFNLLQHYASQFDELVLPIVNDFLEVLFKTENHEKMIFDLIKSLRFISQFDELRYIKRLIGQTKDDSQFQNHLAMFLRSYLRKSDELYEGIACLSQWLPENTARQKDYEQPHILLAFSAFFDLMMNATGRSELKENYYGQPSRCLLFRALKTEKTSENIMQLMNILVHPGAAKVLQDRGIQQIEKFVAIEWLIVPIMFKTDGKFSPELEPILPHIFKCAKRFMADIEKGTFTRKNKNYSALLAALLIGKWRMVLQGNLKSPMSAEAENLYQVIQTCFHSLDSQFQQQVRDYLNGLKILLMNENEQLDEDFKTITVSIKMATQISRQLSMRTNYLVRLRKELII